MNIMNIANLDLNLLKTFEALHDESSASRAALRLGVTQSAISAALRRLRDVYDDQLFVRTGRGLAPTLRANQLKPVISEALDKCRQSLAMIDPQTSHYDGRSVIVGLSDDFELAYGRKLIEEVAQRAPGLRLIFRQTHSQIVGRNLMERNFDLAITAGGFTERLLSRQVLGEGDYACLVDPDSLEENQQTLSLESFVGREHLLVSSGGFIGITDEGLAGLGLSRKVCASTTHFAALPFLLQGSRAVATIPGHAARAIAAFGSLTLLPCPLVLPRYPIELGWRTHTQMDPAVVKVREAIVATFA
ncbi:MULTISPECIES: LysR family transcriptional regulator [unclassified Pseudomonas]|uniref:LysR family transcriptional regulator n=1 Tax=unclassified Pseudomonas TaxID=196821 RepID=UPI00119C2755|nr:MULTISPECIES: LysR family transcriptional regulator [unclassified Pseudomonas]TWC23059.1 LysR family transcriptional regulator [Pseudomonas sp. SJZ075]TWC24677.1 LysR family transcriptional regulator [Pseudomonas sp. SJZ074]TWC38061.1 LysR family transcriptional regulator [Pseudomonas sp. SJZ078]TWC41106.1 LysR family transcriptional regulator [Pseudomonas sp. SJZ085]TWC58651.1 LysR family transcriptional regulator [Pseudomonas sp. SJZ124]